MSELELRLVAIVAAGVVLAASPIQGQRRVTGLVYDALTREPLSGAWVAVLDMSAAQEISRAVSDEHGRFTVEFASPSVTLLAGKTGYAQSAPVVVRVADAQSEEALIGLRTLDEAAIEVAVAASKGGTGGPARVLGRVLDRENGRPVLGAEISLDATGDRTISGGEGAFSFVQVTPGPNIVRVNHLAYGERSRIVSLDEGSAYEITIRLTSEPIELEGIDVSVRSRAWIGRMDDVWARMNRGMGGHFILPEELEMRSAQPLNSVLSSVPSLHIRSMADDLWNQRIFLRNSCKAALWVDGIEVFNPGEDDMPGPPPPLQDFLRISTLDVAVIEIFPGPSSLPPEFARPGTSCAVAVWTKR